MAGFCGHGNEYYGSINGGKLTDWETILLLGFYSIELIRRVKLWSSSLCNFLRSSVPPRIPLWCGHPAKQAPCALRCNTTPSLLFPFLTLLVPILHQIVCTRSATVYKTDYSRCKALSVTWPPTLQAHIMAGDDLQVRWKHHQVGVMEYLRQLLVSEVFVDVTLCCQSKRFKAHRILLSSCSSYLQVRPVSNSSN
jgi:hypothetical protein